MSNWLRDLRKAFRVVAWAGDRGTTTPAAKKPIRLALEKLEDRCVPASAFLQTNLTSNIAGLAQNLDSNLINPWGLTSGPGSPFWVSDNQTGAATLYNGQGSPQSLIVNIPLNPNDSPAQPHATPTGTVFNTSGSGFDLTSGNDKTSADFLFDTLDGTIAAWNPGVNLHNAVSEVKVAGAVFTGLAIDAGTAPGQGQLYAADWGKGTVDVFDSKFNQIDKGAFQDKKIPSSFRPFNVQDIGGQLYVTYARFDPTTGVDLAAAGNGFVDVFNRDGVLQQRLIRHGNLDSPWGLAVAPKGFGGFGGDLLVGNFGDGHINAYDPHNGHFVGQQKDATGKPITEGNLWALRFGNGGAAGNANTLFFTAGLVDAPATPFGASAGLLGSLQAIPKLSPNASITPNLGSGAFQSFSTVPANGDQNPYGVAFVPSNIKAGGALQAGDVLVSNFNNKANLQGTGSTIVRIAPDGEHSVFFQAPQGAGLTTALGVLQRGFVIVGSVPTTDGTAATVQPGALFILDSNGREVVKITDSALLDSPWDLTINDQGSTAQVFVANAVSGTVTRIDLKIPKDGAPIVESETRIASGFTTRTDPTALLLGPTGLAYDSRTDTLYVASTADNGVFAIRHAGRVEHDEGTGKLIIKDSHLRGPLGLILAPNGDLIVANGDAVNADSTQTSELVEFTPRGQFVGEFSIDPSAGAAFGIAATTTGGELRLAAVNDNTNTLDVWTFETGNPQREHERLDG
jgi:uncharacterized protein (TIGR03118 family)